MRSRYYLDAEFIEDSKTIDLISIGLVAEDGREYYAISTEFDSSKASEWVADNVLNSLPSKDSNLWKPRSQIRDDILSFTASDPNPEFWGEWCSYDWVVFCQLFGTMMDLPSGYPMRCRDIIQYAEDHLGIPSSDLPASPEVDGNHNALLGARTVKERFYWLKWGRNGWNPSSQCAQVNPSSLSM